MNALILVVGVVNLVDVVVVVGVVDQDYDLNQLAGLPSFQLILI